MILAAGRGERMRPLTDELPKPLLKAGPHRLIEYHLYQLADAGFHEVVINVAWLGQKIIDTIGDGGRYGLQIHYSNEGEQALETAGGIVKALPLLGEQAFLVINGDIWTDYPYAKLKDFNLSGLAHLLLVNNPEHNLQGDFAIKDNCVLNQGEQTFTFSGIGVYSPDFFAGMSQGKAPLAPMLREAIERGQVSGEVYQGRWLDIGTPQRLQQLEELLRE
ncbi:MAG TPA: nucleotidyltransferase family protein [Gammaproteobacteria bacterium]